MGSTSSRTASRCDRQTAGQGLGIVTIVGCCGRRVVGGDTNRSHADESRPSSQSHIFIGSGAACATVTRVVGRGATGTSQLEVAGRPAGAAAAATRTAVEPTDDRTRVDVTAAGAVTGS